MKDSIIKTDDYKQFIQDVKQYLQTAQIKAAVSVNRELLNLYWNLAKRIIEKQKQTSWGDGFIKQMSIDLQAEFPQMKGFSKRNLELMRQWYRYWLSDHVIVQQLATQLHQSSNHSNDTNLIFQIPWWHNVVIITKIKNKDEALFYVQKTIQNNWSRAVLTHHIESGLYARYGKAISNFEITLPEPNSDLARQIIKDPYNFDFLTIREKHDEKELEDALVNHVTKFLLELGAGFAYVGRQHKIEVGGDEFFIDLLFYHIKLHCYVVIELKAVKFKPEFAGKLNFYVSAVDGILKSEQDNPTIGILICKSKNNTVVEYALKDIHKPIGVSEYITTRSLPDEFKSSLPTIEEIEAELGGEDE
ncbi:MAG: DUF1016 family protein [Desulfobacterales bacterium]|nr:DUF1016 family protein [Desulfobacterales bacterium]